MHAGIDLAGPVGTPIYATADGVVSEAGYHNGGYGNLVKLDHGRGIETRYGHMSAILVRAGQRVTRGQMIGRMGSTAARPAATFTTKSASTAARSTRSPS